MSKVDAQRAMREAKYARTQASGPTRRQAAAAAAGPSPTPTEGATRTTPARAAAAPTAAAPAATPDATTPDAATASGEHCGHKSMNGRACTREPGHPEKSHRYG